jgi:hypothetical protein
VGPVCDGLCGGSGRFFESGEDSIDLEVSDLACLVKRLASTAAVVDAKGLKDADGRGLLQGDFSNGLGSGCHHDLLVSKVEG